MLDQKSMNLFLFGLLLFLCNSCNFSSSEPLSTGLLLNGIYTNKCLHLCIEPEIYASIYGIREGSNDLIEFNRQDINPDLNPTTPIVCLKDLLELRISLANSEYFGDFNDDKSIAYFKTTVLANHEDASQYCEVNVLDSKKIIINGKQFLCNDYHIQLGDKQMFEKQLFTHVDDRYLLFHLADNKAFEQQQINDLFKAIKFDCI